MSTLPDHRDAQHGNERTPGGERAEGTDDGDALKNTNYEEIDIGEPLELQQEGF